MSDILDALAALSTGVKSYGDTVGTFQKIDDNQLNYLTNAAKLYGLDLGNEGLGMQLDTYRADEPVRGAKREADVLLQQLDAEKRRDAIKSTTGYRDFYNDPRFAEVFNMPAGTERTDAMAQLLLGKGLGKEAEASKQNVFKGESADFARALQLLSLAPSEASVNLVNQYIDKMPVAGQFSLEFDPESSQVFLRKTDTGEIVPISKQQMPFLATALTGADPNFGLKTEKFMQDSQGRNALNVQRMGGTADRASQERIHKSALDKAETAVRTEATRRAKANAPAMTEDEIRTMYESTYRRNNPGTARAGGLPSIGGGGLGTGPDLNAFKESLFGRSGGGRSPAGAGMSRRPAAGPGGASMGMPDATSPEVAAALEQILPLLMMQQGSAQDYSALAMEGAPQPGAGSTGLPPEIEAMILNYLTQGGGAANMHMAPPVPVPAPYQITPQVAPPGMLRRIYGGTQ